MARLKRDKITLIRWKIYIDRARMYIGYAQFLMIGFVFLEVFRDTGFGNLIFNNLIISVPVIFVLFIGVSLFIGRLDTIYGLREEELRNASVANPVMRDILKSLEEVKKELRELKGG